LRTNAHQALRIGLAAVVTLLLFAGSSFAVDTYTVPKGQSLYEIANKFGTTVSTLQKLNGLGTSINIREGRVLRITPSPTNEHVVYGYAQKSGVDVWSGNELATTLHKGDRVVVLYRDEDKFRVRLPDGTRAT